MISRDHDVTNGGKIDESTAIALEQITLLSKMSPADFVEYALENSALYKKPLMATFRAMDSEKQVSIIKLLEQSEEAGAEIIELLYELRTIHKAPAIELAELLLEQA